MVRPCEYVNIFEAFSVLVRHLNSRTFSQYVIYQYAPLTCIDVQEISSQIGARIYAIHVCGSEGLHSLYFEVIMST